MPPLPNTFDEETTALVESTQRRQKDLSDFQIPRLRKCTGPLSAQQRLAAELREDIDTFGEQIQALDVLVDDQRGQKNKKALKAVVDELRTGLAKLRQESRSALLESKRNVDLQSRSQREELLQSSVVNEKRSADEKVTDDVLMKANEQVTEALLRATGLAQSSLERSVLSVQMLESSTDTLRSTSATHDTLTNITGTAKMLITSLEKTDRLDRLIILAALAFFFLVVLFVLQQRIIARSFRIAFWWTRFIPSFGADEELLNMMEKGSASVVTAVTAAGSTVTSVVSSVAAAASSSLLASPSEASESVAESITDFISSVSSTADEDSVTTSATEVHDEL